MIWVYTIIVTFNLDEVYKEFEKKYELFEDLVNEYQDEIVKMLDTYNKAVFYMMILNKDLSKDAVKQLYVTYKEKRNNGEFSLQI